MVAKRKRVSKKTKKSWRKNVDISDVDNFLEDQRLEERLGIKHGEKKDEDLFEIDTSGRDENVSEVLNGETPSANNVLSSPASKSYRLRETQVPKCFEALTKRTAVPVAINVKKGDQNSGVGKRYFQRKSALQEKKILRQLENKNGKKPAQQKYTFNFDVWSTADEKDEKSSKLKESTEWLQADTIRHNLKTVGRKPKQIPKTVLQKTSLLPAVEAPHPGLSYNPSLKDHREILSQVAEKELELIKKEKHLDRVTRNMFSHVTREQMEQDWISEMSVGLTATKSDSDDDDGEEYKALNPAVKNKKKSLQKRRKKREALELKEKLKNQKIEKKKLSDIYKLRLFNEALDKREKRIQKGMEKRREKQKLRPFKTRALSQVKYEEPDVNFLMPEELSGNLRNVKSEGSILYDRFKSLQKRNILQPTLKRYVKKAKVKGYERNHTKMDWEVKDKVILGLKK